MIIYIIRITANGNCDLPIKFLKLEDNQNQLQKYKRFKFFP